MSRAKLVLQKFKEQGDTEGNSIVVNTTFPLDPVAIEKAFMDRMDSFGIEGISVDRVDVDLEGDIVVQFSDENDDELAALFMVDDEDGVIAILLDEDPDSDEVEIIDFDSLSPVIRNTKFGQYVDLTNLQWMNKSTVLSIFQSGQLDPKPPKEKIKVQQDAFGNDIRTIIPSESFVQKLKLKEQGFKTVVRGGKRVRLPVVRRKRKKRLTPRQRVGIRKAAVARKRTQSQSSRKRKRSLAIRKRTGIKRAKAGTAKRFKVRG